MDQAVRTVSRLACVLVVSAGIAGCGSAAARVSVTVTASVISTATMPVLTAAPTTTSPAPSPATPAAPSVTASADPPQTPATSSCEAARRWSQTQGDLTLSMCFEPYPPQLGALTTYEAVVVNSDGQPISDAMVELTMVGGVDRMEGEYDEDFPVTLVSQGAGRYTAQARVGSTGLVLEQLRLEVRHGQQLWTFSLPADDLPPP